VPIRARYCWSGSVELSLLRKGSLQRYRLATVDAAAVVPELQSWIVPTDHHHHRNTSRTKFMSTSATVHGDDDDNINNVLPFQWPQLQL
jgi:hypothetical protein